MTADLSKLADKLADAADDYRFVIPQFHAQNRRKMKERADTIDSVIAELRALAGAWGRMIYLHGSAQTRSQQTPTVCHTWRSA
jgi:hypothetical protein